MAWKFDALGISEQGLVRTVNEDAGCISSSCVAVADGLGGHASGEVASKIAIDFVANFSQAGKSFAQLISEIDQEINIQSAKNSNLAGMGTTLSALQILENEIEIVHVGDSRIYEIKKNSLQQVSHDDTVVQELLDQGRINPEEISSHPARSFLTKAILGEGVAAPFYQRRKISKGLAFLLASDGLTSLLSDLEIQNEIDLNDLAKTLAILKDLILKKGASDNFTIIIAKAISTQSNEKERNSHSNLEKLGAAK